MSRRVLGGAAQVLVVLAVFVGVGALAGVVWEWLWTAPDGVAFHDKWILQPAGPDYAFSGTGWYVVTALVAGALTATVLGWAWPRRELLSLAAFLVGSVLAGWVMFHVGHALGPPDPRVLAVGQPDLTTIPADLLVAGADAHPRLLLPDSVVFTAFPIGAMAAATYVFLVSAGRASRRVRGQHAG